ncbi:MAG: PEP-utilizing enzyme [Candidatus Woesearchaeota archaeon]
MVSDNINIDKIKEKDLVYFGERIEPYFASSIIIRGMLNRDNLNRILELKTGVRWLYTNNYFFIFKADLSQIRNEIEENFRKKGKIYAHSLIRRCIEQGNKLMATSKKIQKEVKTGIDKNKMSELLSEYIIAASNYMIFQNIALFEESVAEITEDLVRKYSKNDKEAMKLTDLITTPSMLTATEREKDDFLKICIKEDNDKMIATHIKKYGWLSIRFFVGEPWTKKDVINRLNDKNVAKEEIAKRKEHRKNVEKMTSLAIERFNTQEKETVKLIRDIVYLRTQRTNFFQESSYYIQPLVKLIAAELRVKYSELLFLSGDEVISALQNQFNYLSTIEKRKTGFLVVFDYDKNIILESEAVMKYVRKRPILDRNPKDVKELYGDVAYQGYAKGKVRIVKTDKDNIRFVKGEVLVSIMTTSNLTLSMEKAMAIITDEGGITCHAAILAREMKKPCIVGTKIATKVLKDGDLVEVDAEKGVVRLL